VGSSDRRAAQERRGLAREVTLANARIASMRSSPPSPASAELSTRIRPEFADTSQGRLAKER